MADEIRERHFAGAGDRAADDIRAHHRRWWQSNGLLFAMLGLLALVVFSMFRYGCSRDVRPRLLREPETPRLDAPPADLRAPVLGTPPSELETDPEPSVSRPEADQ